MIPTRDERLAAGCTCDDDVLIDWVSARVIHVRNDCPLRGGAGRTVPAGGTVWPGAF